MTTAREFTITGCSTRIELDLRPGGRWRACMVRDDDGTEFPSGGEYREVVVPERLVFTWSLDQQGSESQVTITFADHGGKTEMTFHQAGFATGGESAGVAEGWSSSFDRLTDHLTD